MTRKDALAELIAKVEAGDLSPRRLDAEVDAVLRVGTPRMQKEAQWAYRNFPNWSVKEGRIGCCQTDSNGLWWESPKFTTSLDAALALHEAVLPGWTASVGQNAHHADWNAWVRFAQDGTIEQEFTASLDTPARAWLLAILKALHTQEHDG